MLFGYAVVAHSISSAEAPYAIPSIFAVFLA
jgi:hypothetical protein